MRRAAPHGSAPRTIHAFVSSRLDVADEQPVLWFEIGIDIEGYRQEDTRHVGIGDNALLNVDAFT